MTSKEVTSRTLKHRTQELAGLRSIVSKDDPMAQLRHEVQQNREELLKIIGSTRIVISAEEGIAFKTKMGIPWKKFRNISRYTYMCM